VVVYVLCVQPVTMVFRMVVRQVLIVVEVHVLHVQPVMMVSRMVMRQELIVVEVAILVPEDRH